MKRGFERLSAELHKCKVLRPMGARLMVEWQDRATVLNATAVASPMGQIISLEQKKMEKRNQLEVPA